MSRIVLLRCIWMSIKLISIFSIFRFNLHNQCPINIFILNLALADLLFCLFYCPIAAWVLVFENGFLGPNICYATATFRYIVTFTSWMSIAMIAISRCIHVIYPCLSIRLFQRFRGSAMCLVLWIFSTIYLIPVFTEVLYINQSDFVFASRL